MRPAQICDMRIISCAMTSIASRMRTETDVVKANSVGGDRHRKPRCGIIWPLEIDTLSDWAVAFMVLLKRRHKCFGGGLSAA